MSSIDISKAEEFRENIKPLTQIILQRLNELRTGSSAKQAPNEPSIVKAFRKVFNAALVEYVGKEADPPKDVNAWVIDRDPTDLSRRALEVRLLINREQFNDLYVALDTVLKALQRADVTSKQFFVALQEIAAQTAKSPEAIAKAGKLAETGLLPVFIQSLPYKSEILSLDNARFASLTSQERSNLEDSLKARLRQYEEIQKDVSGWIKLNDRDPDVKKVYPLPLGALP